MSSSSRSPSAESRHLVDAMNESMVSGSDSISRHLPPGSPTRHHQQADATGPVVVNYHNSSLDIHPDSHHHINYHDYPSPLSLSPSPPIMDTLELAPGAGLGLFRLGDTLWHVLDMLRARKDAVPKLEVSWDPDNAPKSAVTIHAGPVTMHFPAGLAQHLTLIQVDIEPSLTITYDGTVLASSSHPLTRSGVARTLGPTYAGSGDGTQRLVYPGVTFELAGGGREDRVLRLLVGPREDGAGEGDVPAVEPLTQVTINPGRGATLSLPHDVEVVLHETTGQDLLLDLGTPLRKFWKEDDRLERVWRNVNGSNGSTAEQAPPNAVFWNYFQHGLDFLVVDGVVTKIIAHSNIPGTPQFQQYARCPWVLPTDAGVLDFTTPLATFRSQLPAASEGATQTYATARPSIPAQDMLRADSRQSSASGGGHGGGNAGGKKKKGSRSPPDPTSRPHTPADAGAAAAVVASASEVPADAMVLDRSVEGGLDGVLGMGRSQLVGFEGLIVEVDEASKGIASVLVWRDAAVA